MRPWPLRSADPMPASATPHPAAPRRSQRLVALENDGVPEGDQFGRQVTTQGLWSTWRTVVFSRATKRTAMMGE